MAKKDIVFVGFTFLVWRLGLFLIAIFAGRFLPFQNSFPYVEILLKPTGLPAWLWQWANFDGVYYLILVKHGYDGFGSQAFFPLYSLLIKFLTILVPNYLISGLIISNFSIFLAALVLFKLVKINFNESVARWSILFLFSFPVSFYFGSVYTESLFLLLVVSSFYCRGVWAGLFSMLAGVTRLIGLFLGPALILCKKRNYFGIFSITGLLGFMVYLWWRFGQPLFFLSAQSAFQNNRAASLTSITLPVQVVFRYLKIFLSVSPSYYDFWIALLEIGAFGGGLIVLLVLTFKKKLPGSWLIFSWLAFLLPTFSGTFSSMPRYLLGIFPIFIGLALIKSSIIKKIVLLLSWPLLITLTALFTQGYWVS